jgi:5-methylcytosine-specific restriction endonuclease McrA
MRAKSLTVEEIRELAKASKLSRFYNTRRWRVLSKEVIAENNNECYRCKQAGKYRRAEVVHHVMELKSHPELAYSKKYVDFTDGTVHLQLMPLCRQCHEEIHGRVPGLHALTPERW